MINFLTKCSFFLYGYSTIHFAFLIADTHCFDLNYLDNIFLNVFCISYRRQIFFLVLLTLFSTTIIWTVSFFWYFCNSLLFSCSCHSSYSWYNVGFYSWFFFFFEVTLLVIWSAALSAVEFLNKLHITVCP